MTTFIYHGSIAKFVDNNLFVNGSLIGSFVGLKEAKEYLEASRISEEIADSISVKTKTRNINENDIALALYESGEKRVTDTLVSGFKKIIESKKFYPSDVIVELRQLNEIDTINGKIDYVLNDGSVVYIDIKTNRLINSIIELRESADLLKFMNSNAKNFLHCVKDLTEDN